MKKGVVALAAGLAGTSVGLFAIGRPVSANSPVGRLVVVAENVDVAAGADFAGPFVFTADCHGVTLFVNHTPAQRDPPILLASMQLGIPDGTGSVLGTGTLTMDARADDAGTYYNWGPGIVLFAPRIRPVFHGSDTGPGTHINRAVLFC